MRLKSSPRDCFEIKGYTRKQIEHFSDRHVRIIEKLQAEGMALTTENKIWGVV